MRGFWMIAAFGLVACAGLAPELKEDTTSVASNEVVSGHLALPGTGSTRGGGPFAGAWASCHGASSPEECSRYVLVQQGERICGNWLYLASGKEYEGRLIARVLSSTEARRTHLCGRPGSETNIECSDGWQEVDRPLRLCGGRLSDLGADGRDCVADYIRVSVSQAEYDALRGQPWMRACLSG